MTYDRDEVRRRLEADLPLELPPYLPEEEVWRLFRLLRNAGLDVRVVWSKKSGHRHQRPVRIEMMPEDQRIPPRQIMDDTALARTLARVLRRR